MKFLKCTLYAPVAPYIGLELRLIIRGRFVDDEASHYDAADVFQ